MAEDRIKKIMKIIWAKDNKRWDDLFEYPYNDWDRERILAELEETAKKIDALYW